MKEQVFGTVLFWQKEQHLGGTCDKHVCGMNVEEHGGVMRVESGRYWSASSQRQALPRHGLWPLYEVSGKSLESSEWGRNMIRFPFLKAHWGAVWQTGPSQ